MQVENLKSSTGTREELDRFVLSLIPVVEANDTTVSRTPSQIFGRFAATPVGEGPALDALKAGMCAQFSWQLSALILGNLPDAIAELVVFKVGPHAGALDIPAALYAPHLQPAAIARQNDKDRDIVECSGLQKPLGFRYLLYSFLIRWLAAVKRLTANGELPSDMARKLGLLTAIRFLNYSEEMSRLEKEAKRANKLFQCADVLQELQSMASEWATEEAAHKGGPPAPTIQQAAQPTKGTVPNTPGKKALAKMARALALVAIPGTCHKWLTPTGCQDLANCKFKHPPEVKGRTDLLPLW